jgi:hypothetical protein
MDDSDCDSSTLSVQRAPIFGRGRRRVVRSDHQYNRLVLQALWSVGFGLWGWYYPRYLIAHEEGILKRRAPYQRTAAGDAILNLELNEPLVDSPSITCKWRQIEIDNLLGIVAYRLDMIGCYPFS